MPPKIDGSLTILRDNFDFFFLDPKVVQEQTCEKLKSDFDLSDDEAKNYYLDPQYTRAVLLCAAIENGPPSSELNTVNLTVSPQVAQFLKLL